ncbi:hypothetical protein FZ983_27310 [Azospirillum sp. B21]|uniref:hypothetical protein n=1 Tax=Azospirillum sp. B21 TaxID=2607496 RepID=UPI0011EDA9A2|nr:hypothetical protein [Azospirillum sp. B21]KAA0574611.1 hypothetical protein FZ983_27310 [Azospirillum sp. B21]
MVFARILVCAKILLLIGAGGARRELHHRGGRPAGPAAILLLIGAGSSSLSRLFRSRLCNVQRKQAVARGSYPAGAPGVDDLDPIFHALDAPLKSGQGVRVELLIRHDGAPFPECQELACAASI